MAYPPNYEPSFDLAQAQQDGDVISATELVAELANASDSINQINSFLRSLATADKKIQPNTVVGSTLVEETEITATAGQTDFLYPSGVTVDPVVATVGVFVNGDREDPSNVTVKTDRVTLAAKTAGDIVVLEIHDNAESILADLASTAANFGASLVGLEDIAGRYGADNVEAALGEVMSDLNTLVTNLGVLSTIVRADGSVPFTSDVDFGTNKLLNVKDGTADTDGVNLKQLNDTLDQLTSLTDKFLPRTGGVMQGNISMSSKRITNLSAPVTDNDAARKGYVDNADDALRDAVLSLEGLADSVTRGTMTGPATYGQASTDVADADQTTSPEDVTTPTWSGVPKPGADDHVVNKKYVDEVVSLDSSGGSAGDGISDSIDPCADGPNDEENFGTPTNIGFYEFLSVNWDGIALPMAGVYRLRDGGTLTGTITPERHAEGEEANRLSTIGAWIGESAPDLAIAGAAGGGGSYREGGFGEAGSTTATRGGVGVALEFSSFHNYWGRPTILIGGQGGDQPASGVVGGQGGGSVIIVSAGDLDLSGVTLDVSGANGVGGGSGDDSGAGGGGSVWILCAGTITTDANTVINARGGDFGGDGLQGGGGGAGGVIVVAAAAFAGPGITANSSGGAGASDGENGDAGWSDIRTVDADLLNSLIQFYGISEKN